MALVATAVIAAPTPVQEDIVARDAAPAPAPTDYGSYGAYGTYGTYDSYPSAIPTPSPTPTVVSYGSYVDYPTSYATYTDYKRALGDLVRRVWA